MSEGKYPRLPKPKDRSKLTVTLGTPELVAKHDKEGEWAEEGDAYRPHEKRAAEPSTTDRIKKMASELGAAVSSPWARLLKKDDEE